MFKRTNHIAYQQAKFKEAAIEGRLALHDTTEYDNTRQSRAQYENDEMKRQSNLTREVFNDMLLYFPP